MSATQSAKKPRVWVIALIVLAMAAGGGFLIWRTATDPVPGARNAARRAADALAAHARTKSAKRSHWAILGTQG